MGLKIISVEVGEGAETIIMAEIPEEVRMEMESKTKKRKPSLVEVMRTLAGRAELERGQVQRMELSGGLGIDMMCGIDGKRRLQIWREGVSPAAREWGIVVGVCPGAPKRVEYTQFTSKGRWYLRGEWKETGRQVEKETGRQVEKKTGKQVDRKEGDDEQE
jgi:hypothetical protein